MRPPLKEKLIYFAPWIFAAACTLLAGTIVLLAMSTYKREVTLKQSAIQQQTESVVRGISLSMRKAQRAIKRDGQVSLSTSLQQAIDDATVQAGVSAIYVVAESGRVVAFAVNGDAKKVLVPLPSDFLENALPNLQRSPFYLDERKGDRFLVLAPFREGRPMHHNMRHRSTREMSPMKFNEEKLFLVLDLNLGEFNRSFESTRKQIYLLSFILLLVISGSYLSFLTLRGLSVSQRKLAGLGAFQQQLLASLPVGLIAVGEQGQIRLFNAEFEQIDRGFSRNILGKTDEDLGRHFSLDMRKRFRGEISNMYLDGELKVLLFSKVQLTTSDNRPDGYVLLVEDITEQYALREELERSSRMASLGKMAAGVAHELRNPLSSVKGLGVLLQSRFEKGSDDFKTAAVMVAEVDRLNRSISELLDFAKPQDKGGELFPIRRSIQKAVDLVAMDIEEMSAQFEMDLPDQDMMVQGDEDKLNQVFLNLLLNSIQAIDEFGRIRIGYTLIGTSQICVNVEDDGSGIAEEIGSQIYDPYFTTKAEGTGLGLAVSSKVIEEHMGTLSVANGEKGGAISRVILPLQ